MREQLRRLWRELTYDPLVGLHRAKELLARRLEWSAAKEHERHKSKLKLWRPDQPKENK